MFDESTLRLRFLHYITIAVEIYKSFQANYSQHFVQT